MELHRTDVGPVAAAVAAGEVLVESFADSGARRAGHLGQVPDVEFGIAG